MYLHNNELPEPNQDAFATARFYRRLCMVFIVIEFNLLIVTCYFIWELYHYEEMTMANDIKM